MAHEEAETSNLPEIDARLVQWLAAQVQHDRHARLAESGASFDTRLELADLFIDLPVWGAARVARGSEKAGSVMPLLLGQPGGSCQRWLLVGGPGSGKSTVTTMVAQMLRLPWIERQAGVLPEHARQAWEHARARLLKLATEGGWRHDLSALPLRLNLPSLARWLASQGDGAASLWDYLAAQMVRDLGGSGITTEVSARRLRAMAEQAGTIAWILDGLDEVPPSAGRRRMLDVVRATLSEETRRADPVVVSTRPQGYQGELDDLDAVVLNPLPRSLALRYAERLLTAWSGPVAPTALDARLEKLRGEFAKPEVVELIQTPLHTTLAALLVAAQNALPAARSKLFEEYFRTILKRELGKPFEHGIQEADEGVLRMLHQRAGLALHVRSQEQQGARSTLRRRELRGILTEVYAELGVTGDEVRANVDRIMRFAADRLVLLLHASEGDYTFGVRSLQEFFAAEALCQAETEKARGQLEAIALDPHWSNVLAFVVSRLALATAKPDRDRAVLLIVSLCRALNEGTVGGEAAKRCFLGSRLAIVMLRETSRYGHPWLHDPLWEIALQATDAPAQRIVGNVVRMMGSRRRSDVWNDDVEIHTRLGLLAADWTGPQSDRRRRLVMQAAEPLLARGGAERLNGWRLLHGLLTAEVPEAIAMANAHAPTTGEEAREVLAVMRDEFSTPSPRWLHGFVDQHEAWFTPKWGAWRFADEDQDEGEALALKVHHLLDTTLRLLPLRWGSSSRFTNGGLFSIEMDVSAWQLFESKLPEKTPAWTVWKRVARFMAAPSHTALADVLETVGSEDAFNELRALSYMLPWPLRACLTLGPDPKDASALAQQAREGRLGSIDEWKAAEDRWRRSPCIVLEEVGHWLEADGPWNHDIASRGMILWSWPDPSTPDEENAKREAFSWLLHWIEGHVPPPRKALNLLVFAATGDLGVPWSIARLLENTPGLPKLPLTVLLPDLEGPDATAWFTLLDARGRTSGPESVLFGRHAVREPIVRVARALIDRLRTHPEQWGLLEALWSLIPVLLDLDLSALTLPDLPAGTPARALATRAALALATGHATPNDTAALLAQLRFEQDGTHRDLREQLAGALFERARAGLASPSLLLAALDAEPPPEPAARDALLGALYAQQQRCLVPAFASPEAWRSHHLPEPCLAGLPPPPPPPRLVGLAEIRNIRLFKDTPTVSDPFPRPDAGRGQWIVLVGENGVGKTTLLRVLALALAAPPVASKLLDERLPMVRNGGEGHVAIELASGRIAVAVRRGERTEVVEAIGEPIPEHLRPWVVGYGVRRGNARGEKDREPEVGPIGELHTLFDRPASLHNATKWLSDLDADVLREQRRSPPGGDRPPGPKESVWQAVQQALSVLLGITRIEVDEGGLVHVHHPQFGRVRLDALSDGYLTTAGWMIDLVARWVARQEELDEPVGADLLDQMCGFVLLDEIDLHLHPMWQLRIIEDVRRLFRRLSFVVTTHNPLTLQGARRGEVYVMRRDGAHIELVQRDIRPGHDVDRVLLEQFGVEHTFDRETRDLLAHHRALLERGAPPDDPERRKIEEQLTERLGEIGDTLRNERHDHHGPVAPLNAEERARLAPFLKKS